MGKDETNIMSKQQHDAVLPYNAAMPWWIRFCSWLWKLSAFLGISVILALGVNIVSTWLITPKGILPSDTPLSLLIEKWPISLAISVCLILFATLIWAISRWKIPSGTIAEASDEREAAQMTIFSKLETMMPELLQEMRQDLAAYPLKREFILLKRAWSYGGSVPLRYYYDTHDDLDDKITILCNYGLFVDITSNNTKRYNFTENFVAYLTKDNPSTGAPR